MTQKEESIQKIIIDILHMPTATKAHILTDYPTAWAWIEENVTDAYNEVEAETPTGDEVSNGDVEALALSKLRVYAITIIETLS